MVPNEKDQDHLRGAEKQSETQRTGKSNPTLEVKLQVKSTLCQKFRGILSQLSSLMLYFTLVPGFRAIHPMGLIAS